MNDNTLNKVTELNEKCASIVFKFQAKAKSTQIKFEELAKLLLKSSIVSIFKTPDMDKIQQKVKSCLYDVGLLEGMTLQMIDILSEMETLLNEAGKLDERKEEIKEIRENLQRESVELLVKKEMLNGWISEKTKE